MQVKKNVVGDLRNQMMKQQVTVTILTTIMILNHLGVEVELTNKD